MEQIQNATLYIWHNRQKPIEVNDDSLKFIMSSAGAQIVLDFIRLREEFNAGYGISIYESPEFYVRHQPSSVTEELEKEGFYKVGAMNAVRPGFPSTVLLEERLKELDLECQITKYSLIYQKDNILENYQLIK